MMLFHEREVIEGVTVFRDDVHRYTYYLLPSQPRFRLDDNGRPVFRFIKYRVPIDRADGKKGGGFAIFDVEFVVPDDVRLKIKTELEKRLPPPDPHATGPAPQIVLSDIVFTKGTASVLLFQENGTLVEKIHSPGKPSLYGNNVTAVTIELTDLGATVAEQALQGQGGVVQVCYDLTCAVKLPNVKIDGYFHASQFYSFYQEIDTEWNLWSEDSYRETIREKLIQSEAMSLVVDGGPFGASNPDLMAELRNWAQGSLEDAIERNMISAATPVSEEDRDLPDGIEDVTRDISNHKISDVQIHVREKAVIEWNPAPQGTLPNITSLEDLEGRPISWSDHATTVSADDPFFQELRIRASVNADFEALPLHSVDVSLKYDSDDGEKIVGQSVKSPNDVVKLDAYIKDGNRKFQYAYKVNYRGADRALETDWTETDSPFLTINVGDLGYLEVGVQAGDIDFEQVKSVFVVMKYEDPAAGVEPIEDQLTLTKDSRSHQAFKRIIYARAKRPFRYTATYHMADGKELTSGEISSRARQVFINDPFSAIRTINLRTWGNLEDHVQTIYLDLEYVDEANDYRKVHSVALSKGHPFEDWGFPVIRESGTTLIYRGEYILFNGERRPIPPTETTDRTLLFGLEPPDKVQLSVEVLADLIDFEQVKLVKVALEYRDPDNDVIETAGPTFKAGVDTTFKWSFEVKDQTKRAYTWSATFYMVDSTRREIELTSTSESTLVLEVPPA